MDRARRDTRLTLAALGTVVAAAIAIAVVAIAAAGGGEDVADVASDDPGERRGATEGGRSRTVEVSAAVQLLPLAKRTNETRPGRARRGRRLRLGRRPRPRRR